MSKFFLLITAIFNWVQVAELPSENQKIVIVNKINEKYFHEICVFYENRNVCNIKSRLINNDSVFAVNKKYSQNVWIVKSFTKNKIYFVLIYEDLGNNFIYQNDNTEFDCYDNKQYYALCKYDLKSKKYILKYYKCIKPINKFIKMGTD